MTTECAATEVQPQQLFESSSERIVSDQQFKNRLDEYRLPDLPKGPGVVEDATSKKDCGCHNDASEKAKATQRFLNSREQEKCIGRAVIPIYYVTDRKPIRDANGKITGFNSEANYKEEDGSVTPEISYGKEYVQTELEADHSAKKSQAACMGWKLGAQCDEVEVGVPIPMSKEEFETEIEGTQKKLQESGYKPTVDLVVHGHGTPLKAGILQAGEILEAESSNEKKFAAGITRASDIAQFAKHPMILYSPPAQTAVLGYWADVRGFKYSQFGTFPNVVESAGQKFGYSNVNLMLHSRSNEAGIEYLNLRAVTAPCGQPKEKFNHIVLASADYGLRTFALLAEKVAQNANEVRVMVNSHDRVLGSTKPFLAGELPLGMATYNDVFRYRKQIPSNVSFQDFDKTIPAPEGFNVRENVRRFLKHFPLGAVNARELGDADSSVDGICERVIPQSTPKFSELFMCPTDKKK